jgi:hypothetical protein
MTDKNPATVLLKHLLGELAMPSPLRTQHP